MANLNLNENGENIIVFLTRKMFFLWASPLCNPLPQRNRKWKWTVKRKKNIYSFLIRQIFQGYRWKSAIAIFAWRIPLKLRLYCLTGWMRDGMSSEMRKQRGKEPRGFAPRFRTMGRLRRIASLRYYSSDPGRIKGGPGPTGPHPELLKGGGGGLPPKETYDMK